VPERPTGEDVLARQRILAVVHQYPGLHLREIQRRAETSAALCEYHLNVLEGWGLVTSSESGGYRRFFPARKPLRPLTREDKEVLAVIRQEVPLGIILYLIERPIALHKELLDVVPVTKSTLTYHLKNLIEAGIVERTSPPEGKGFRLVGRDRVLQLLQDYGPTPDLVDAYGDLWNQIFTVRRQRDPDESEP